MAPAAPSRAKALSYVFATFLVTLSTMVLAWRWATGG